MGLPTLTIYVPPAPKHVKISVCSWVVHILNKSKTFTAEIEKFDHEMRGISRIDGKTVFIDGAMPEESVSAIYTRRKSRYGEARVDEVLQPHQQRVAPRCPHHDFCGGCRIQYIPAEMQIAMKQQILAEHLQNTANLMPETWLPPITADTWGYRRKARLGVRYVEKKGLLIGFREKYSKRYLADIETCVVLDERVGLQLPQLRATIDQLSIKKVIPQIEVACSDRDVALIIRHLEPFTPADIDTLIDYAKQTNFRIYTQSKGLDSIQLLYPDVDPLLDYDLPAYNINLQFHPRDFTQVNAAINQKMIDLALETLDLQATDTVLDLFCGIGNFSLPMARKAKHVTGIEFDEAMVHRASENAARNQCHNTEFFAADLTKQFGGVAWFKREYDKILLDPPRTGALNIIEQFAQFKAKKIVYISCNPATLARDAAALVQQGYTLRAAGVMDMFPHTRHVEAIASFERKNGKN